MHIRHKVPKEASEPEMNEKAIRDIFSNYDDNQSFNLVIVYTSRHGQSFLIAGKEVIIQIIIAKMNQDTKAITARNKVVIIDFSKVEYIEVNPTK